MLETIVIFVLIKQYLCISSAIGQSLVLVLILPLISGGDFHLGNKLTCRDHLNHLREFQPLALQAKWTLENVLLLSYLFMWPTQPKSLQLPPEVAPHNLNHSLTVSWRFGALVRGERNGRNNRSLNHGPLLLTCFTSYKNSPPWTKEEIVSIKIIPNEETAKELNSFLWFRSY